MMKYLFAFFLALSAPGAAAQQYLLSGRVTDKQNKPLGFTAVYIKNSSYGTLTNEDGVYQFKLYAGKYAVVYRFADYRERVEQVNINNRDAQRNIQLEPDEFALNTDGIKKYGNADPGDAIIAKVIAKRLYYLNEVKSYSCAVYIKGVQRLFKAPKSLLGSEVVKALSLDSNGRTILYQNETISEFNFEQPNRIREVTIATKSAGQNTAFGYSKASDLQVNFYENVFVINGISSRGFVSPVAAYAPSLYDYKLLGTLVDNGRTIDKIQVIPKRPHGQYFQGDIYIVDGEWRIYGVALYLTKKMDNLNLVDTLQISQQYVPIRDSIWMPESASFNFKGNVLGFIYGGYYASVYNNYKIDTVFKKGFFTGEVLKVDTAANIRNEGFWVANRPIPLTRQETNDYQIRDRKEAYKLTDHYLDSIQHTKNRINIPGYLIFGYNASSRNEKDSLYLYPFLQTLYYNTVEGFGINLKLRYTKIIDDLHSVSFTPDLRYGFANKLLSANLHTEYKFDPFHAAKWSVDFGSDVLDLNNVGTRSLYFNTLSTLLSENNYVKYYRSEYAGFGYQRELANGVLWMGGLNYSNRTQLYNTAYGHIFTAANKAYTSNNPLAPPAAPADDQSQLFPQHQALTFNTSFAFTFDQQYITRSNGKFNLPSKYPTLTVNYRKGINGVLGSDVNYDFASADVSQDHVRVGLLGFSAFKITAGDFFNNKTVYYMDYYHFLGNQGTTFDPTYVGSFHFLPFYTYSTNGPFLEAHYQHNFAGSVFKQIPFLRKLKLEEIIGANYLSTKNNLNYSEYYVGVQRLIFRIDYGVSYAGNQKYLQGIRIFYGLK